MPAGVSGRLVPLRPGTAPTVDLPLLVLSALPAGVSFVRASAASWVDAGGVLRSAAAGQPRFDRDPVTGAARGLLIEPQRTNIVYPSTPGAGWTAYYSNLTAAAGLAPDGTTTAVRITPTTPNNLHFVQFNMTLAEQAWRFSAYLKAAEYTKATLRLGGSQPCNAVFDLAAVTVVESFGPQPVAAGIADAGNGWRRAWIATAHGNPSTNDASVGPVADGYTKNLTSYYVQFAGDPAKGILAWGAQMEAGTSVTSLIPTVSAAVTRAADAAALALGPWFDPLQGMLAIEWQSAAADHGGSPALAALSDGSMANLIRIGLDSAAAPDEIVASMVAGGVTKASRVLGTEAAGPVRRAALGWRSGRMACTLDGAGAAIDSPDTLPGGLTTLHLGSRPDGTAFPCCHLRRVRTFSRYRSEVGLRSLTG